MNSVFEIPTVVYNSILHSFTSILSPCPQTWSIEMADLESKRSYRCPIDYDDDYRSTIRSTQSAKSTHRPRIFEPVDTSASDHRHAASGPIIHPPRHHHDPPTSPPPDPPSTSSSQSDPPTYLCTFCWRPHHSAITPSRTVGRRARLACEPCYSALLDLAVC